MHKTIFPKRKSLPICAKIRHTHRTAAGLEDALAVSTDIINELLRSQAYVITRVNSLSSILRETRPGPYAYNPERAAGMRFSVVKR